MDHQWLQDLVELSGERNCSNAAGLHHVTQPQFSPCEPLLATGLLPHDIACAQSLGRSAVAKAMDVEGRAGKGIATGDSQPGPFPL